jgi:hypothetical protein
MIPLKGMDMGRNVLICLFVLSLGLSTFVGLTGQSRAYGDSISGDASTVALGRLVLSDDFEDGKMASMWRLLNDDPNNAALAEVNGRLEYRSNSVSSGKFAGYVSSGWRLDATKDFSFRTSTYYDLKTLAGGWIGLGLGIDGENPRKYCVEMGIGCSNLLQAYQYNVYDEGMPADSGRVSRFKTTCTLYFSYTAENDTLYISDSGYGVENAWMTFPDLIQGRWEAESVYIYLGGHSEELQITAGHAYIDNLIVDKGVAAEAVLKPVYRFWSPVLGSHFYTMSESEKDYVLLTFPAAWAYEGIVFYAYPDGSDPTSRPVYRFWSEVYGKHFFTISEENKDVLISDYSDIWTYEGIAFYAYAEGKQPAWAQPVHRFWSAPLNAHFYTIDEYEKSYVLGLSDFWAYEGIAWYAVAP